MYTLVMHRASDIPVSDWGEPQSSYDYLSSRGVSIVRLPISWGTLQPASGEGKAALRAALDEPLDRDALSMLHEQVDRIHQSGMRVVLDLHNGCSYPTGPKATKSGSLICGDDLTRDDQVRIWISLSSEFRNDPAIYAYDIFNEPRTALLDFETYRSYSKAVVEAIRANGDSTTIWLQAMLGDWTFARKAQKGPWILDANGKPDQSIVYSQHFYPSLTATQQVPFDTLTRYSSFHQSIEDFGQWCEKWSVGCSIGEIGWPGTGSSETTAEDLLNWQTLGERAYATADRYGMDVTYFAAMGSTDSRLLAYDSTEPTFPVEVGIDQALSPSRVIEQFPSSDKR